MKHSQRALKIWDSVQKTRDDQLWEAMDMEAFEVWEKAVAKDLNAVRTAFYLDTMHVNSKERAMIADIGFIRRCVENWEKSSEPAEKQG
jgi:hypothetical protein